MIRSPLTPGLNHRQFLHAEDPIKEDDDESHELTILLDKEKDHQKEYKI